MIRRPQGQEVDSIQTTLLHNKQKLTSFDGWEVGLDVGWDDGEDVGCFDGACEGLFEGELVSGLLFGDFVGLDEGELVVGGRSTLSMVWTTLLQAATSKGEMTFESLILIPVSVSGTPVVTKVVSLLNILSFRLSNNWELNNSSLGTIWYRRTLARNGISPCGIPPRISSNASSVGAV